MKSVDLFKRATRELVCNVCKGKIEKGSSYVASGLPMNQAGGNSVFIPAHTECASLRAASFASRSRS